MKIFFKESKALCDVIITYPHNFTWIIAILINLPTENSDKHVKFNNVMNEVASIKMFNILIHRTFLL